jgi:predicted ester cyclase
MQSIEELGRQFFAVLDSQDWTLLDKLVDRDALIQVGSTPPVKFSETQNLRALYAAFPDGHHIIDECLVVGDKCITRCRFEGSHQGAFRNIPPSGKAVSFTIMHIDRFENGILVEHYGQPDMLSLMKQIGAIA